MEFMLTLDKMQNNIKQNTKANKGETGSFIN